MAACFAQMVVFIGFVVFMSEMVNVAAFKVDLYQRDSYGSPFYDQNLSETEIIRKAIARSVNRSSLVTINSPVADLFDHGGQYLMKIRIGTPPVDVLAVADTGSDLTWTQCKPCTRCVPQSLPLFNPHASSSYTKIPCGPSQPCPRPHTQIRCKADGFCHHYIHYDDQSYSKGVLSSDAMRIDSIPSNHPIVEIPEFKFGCGTDNFGNFGNIGSGVIGLGAGPLSLVSQLVPLTGKRFSYCLIPLGKNGVSRIHFGHDAVVEGPGTITTPLVRKNPTNKYFVTLEAFTIGGTRIDFTGRFGTVEEGNIAIDTGSTLMTLPRFFYARMKHVVAMQISSYPVADPDGKLDLCYRNDQPIYLPSIVANFRGGDVTLNSHNVFVNMGRVICLAFEMGERFSVYGSLAQQDFAIGFDGTETVSFNPLDCLNF